MVGNYPKISPDAKAPSLRTAISRFDESRITLEELKRVEEEVTKEVIQDQVDAGLDLVTDGQIRWDDGQTYIARGIQGFTVNGLIRYFDTNTYYRHPIPENRLQSNGAITVKDYEFAAANSARPVKAVITGPYSLARLSQLGCYEDLRSLVMDLVPILNREAKALQSAGASVIQFDEPSILKHKEDIDLFAEAIEGVTAGITATTGVCTIFGDATGIHSRLFSLPVDIIGLDFVAGPANYDLIGELPQEKKLGCGIVDARNTRLETVEDIAEAIKRVSGSVSPDRLYINPSCGLDFLPRPNARAKLTRLVEGAKKAQEDLS
jgi:5-methyltetrahydropteroyltriglutamate--homocysteine methyltransferase